MGLAVVNPFGSFTKIKNLMRDVNQGIDWRHPSDPGLMGPGPARAVIRDDCILVGGIVALMLQMLHPVALAAITLRSNYQADPLDRLVTTGRFVRTTALGSTAAAEQAIAGVRVVHDRVKGFDPSDPERTASDPELLRWVGACEAYGFIRAYQRFHPDPPRGKEVDHYYRQMVVVAERLGADWMPKSRLEIDEYFERMRPELERSADSDANLRYVTAPPLDDAGLKVGFRVVGSGATALLPDWARRMHGLQRTPGDDLATVQLQAFFRGLRAVPMNAATALVAA